MIKAFLSFNSNYEPRIIRFYTSQLISNCHTAYKLTTQEIIENDNKMLNIIPFETVKSASALRSLYESKDCTIVYSIFSSLYIAAVIDDNEDPLQILDFLKIYLSTLDIYFKDIRELDIINHFDQCNYLLDEFISSGFLITTNSQDALLRFEEKNQVEVKNTSAKEVYYKVNEYLTNKFSNMKSSNKFNIFK
ncbi:MAG: AP-3 complex subunit sigma-1 [Marteilia pararefringens]